MGGEVLEGIVTSGLGKGAVFMSIDYYKSKVREKLGFSPYIGTLNLKLDENSADLFKKIKKTSPIRIEGFKKGNKTFGGSDCYKIRINAVNASIIIPDMTENEENIVEIIAPVNLKSELNIKDGDQVKIELKWQK